MVFGGLSVEQALKGGLLSSLWKWEHNRRESMEPLSWVLPQKLLLESEINLQAETILGGPPLRSQVCWERQGRLKGCCTAPGTKRGSKSQSGETDRKIRRKRGRRVLALQREQKEAQRVRGDGERERERERRKQLEGER